MVGGWWNQYQGVIMLSNSQSNKYRHHPQRLLLMLQKRDKNVVLMMEIYAFRTDKETQTPERR
jgi:hypothetical protein